MPVVFLLLVPSHALVRRSSGHIDGGNTDSGGGGGGGVWFDLPAYGGRRMRRAMSSTMLRLESRDNEFSDESDDDDDDGHDDDGDTGFGGGGGGRDGSEDGAPLEDGRGATMGGKAGETKGGESKVDRRSSSGGAQEGGAPRGHHSRNSVNGRSGRNGRNGRNDRNSDGSVREGIGRVAIKKLRFKIEADVDEWMLLGRVAGTLSLGEARTCSKAVGGGGDGGMCQVALLRGTYIPLRPGRLSPPASTSAPWEDSPSRRQGLPNTTRRRASL